jgi:ASC-1-like (ASCH) protein
MVLLKKAFMDALLGGTKTMEGRECSPASYLHRVQVGYIFTFQNWSRILRWEVTSVHGPFACAGAMLRVCGHHTFVPWARTHLDALKEYKKVYGSDGRAWMDMSPAGVHAWDAAVCADAGRVYVAFEGRVRDTRKTYRQVGSLHVCPARHGLHIPITHR